LEAQGSLPPLPHAKVQPIRKDRPGICKPVKSFTLKMRITQTFQAPFCWGCSTLWVLYGQHGVSAAPGPYGSPSKMSCSGAGCGGTVGWEPIMCFVRGVGGLSGSWQYRKSFAIWLFTWEPCALSSRAKCQEIYALDKKASLWPVLLFMHI